MAIHDGLTGDYVVALAAALFMFVVGGGSGGGCANKDGGNRSYGD